MECLASKSLTVLTCIVTQQKQVEPWCLKWLLPPDINAGSVVLQVNDKTNPYSAPASRTCQILALKSQTPNYQFTMKQQRNCCASGALLSEPSVPRAIILRSNSKSLRLLNSNTPNNISLENNLSSSAIDASKSGITFRSIPLNYGYSYITLWWGIHVFICTDRSFREWIVELSSEMWLGGAVRT